MNWMLFKNSVEYVYETFITHVSKGRGISTVEVDKIGQGRVWSGVDAKFEIGLIDEIGGLEDIELHAELSELEDYRIITLPNKKDEFDEFLKKLTIEQKYISKENDEFF